MKTEVLMKRDFYQTKINQRSSDKFFNATDLLKFYNEKNNSKKVIAEFWSNKSTQAFMDALAMDLNLNVGKSLYLKSDLFESKKGKLSGGTYMHPYLFVKFAMWLSPEFEVQVIKWVYDNLIDFRNNAGDHYKEMCSAINERYVEYYKEKPDPLIFQREATFLNQLTFGDARPRQRNEATEKQLDLLNKLQLANIKLIKEGLDVIQRKQRVRDFANIYKSF